MDGACSTHGRDGVLIQHFCRKILMKETTRKTGIDGKIILE